MSNQYAILYWIYIFFITSALLANIVALLIDKVIRHKIKTYRAKLHLLHHTQVV